tara:strand:+ start:30293 stop:31474 length:1182 start_codon:yes stop_codon:yes gene_type:complete
MPTGDAVPQIGKAVAFASLMQGTATAPSDPTIPVQPQLATELSGATAAPTTDPEELDTATPDGILALLDHTIAGLESGSDQITNRQVLDAFAEALGSPPVESLGDLAAVSQLDDGALEEALQARIAGALRTTTGIGQLSVASSSVPAVGRLPVASQRADISVPSDGIVAMAKASAEQPTPRDLLASGGAQPPVQAAETPSSTAAAKFVVPGHTASSPEAITRDVPIATGGVPLTPDLSRIAPTPSVTPAFTPDPATAPDEQLRQHVSHQIRSADTSDSKFRFSLTPYGMGEIEIEIGRTDTGRVQISMTTESASVLNILRQDRDQLLDALQSRGVAAENADLDFQTFGERGRQGQKHFDAGPFSDHHEGAEPIDEPALAARATTGNGLLDILT